MNVLETFFYLFESDASKLDEGLKKSDQAAKGVEKSLDAVDRRASMVGSSLLSLVKGLGAGLAAGLSAGALMGMVRNTSEAVYAVDELSDALDLNASELEAWDSAANAAGVGGSLGGLTNSMRAFNERVQDLTRRESPELLQVFQQVGLSLDDVKAKASDPLALLRDMADGMHELSAAEAVGLGQKLGLDIGTVNLLRQGKAGLDEIVAAQKELGFITDEQIERNRSYRDALDRMNRVFDDVRRRVVFFILPALERLANFFEAGARLARDHAGAIKWGVGIVALALTGMMIPALLRAATATRALWLALGRFAPIAAALGAVALVAEDLYEYMRGNDSAVGELIKKWPVLGEAIQGVGHVLAWMIDLVVTAGDALVTLFTDGPEAAFERMREAFRRIGADVEGLFPSLEGAADLIAGLGEAMLWPFRVLVEAVQGATTVVTALLMDGPVVAFREFDSFISGVADKFPVLGGAARLALDVMKAGVGQLNTLWDRLLGLVIRAINAISVGGNALGRFGRWLTGRGGEAEEEEPSGPPRNERGVGEMLLGRDSGGPSAVPAATPVPPTAVPQAVPVGVAAGRERLVEVQQLRVGETSSAAVTAGATNNRSTSVQVDRVEVNTQATDADGIAQGIGGALEREMRSAADAFDDGVAA